MIHGHRMNAGEWQKIKQNRPSKKLNHNIVAHMNTQNNDIKAE